VRQAIRERRSGTVLGERLRGRREEIEQATRTRMHAVSVLPRTAGPEYAEGLRTAVSTALDYGIAGIERGDKSPPPIPEALLSQARLAARSRVSLDTVLRRYFAGHTLLEDFLIEEAEREVLLDPAVLKRLLRSQAAIVDRLLAAVSEAYVEEAGRRPLSSEQRLAERIERLLDGEPLDTADLAYDFDGWHVGMVCVGQGGSEVIAAVAKSLDCLPLSVRVERGHLWAWLGSRRKLDLEELRSLVSPPPADELTLAIGEPGKGLAGWRLTLHQARAALPVALRNGERFARYVEVGLLASALQDDLLVASLRALYLAPLEREGDSGKTARETLRAYFAAECNVSSAAAAMEVSRRTVGRRLRSIEARLGSSPSAAMAEIETALDLHDLEAAPGVPTVEDGEDIPTALSRPTWDRA
jgi:PucR C-terminal helix-turn-helix domain